MTNPEGKEKRPESDWREQMKREWQDGCCGGDFYRDREHKDAQEDNFEVIARHIEAAYHRGFQLGLDKKFQDDQAQKAFERGLAEGAREGKRDILGEIISALREQKRKFKTTAEMMQDPASVGWNSAIDTVIANLNFELSLPTPPHKSV